MADPTPPARRRDEAYDQRFYDEIRPLAASSAAVVVPIVAGLVEPGSVIDVGCGQGSWLAEWARRGVDDVLGLDGGHVDPDSLQIDRSRFQVVDLEDPPAIDRSFDLAMSVEVAEHLTPASAPAFVALLTSLAPVVLFSAALPGQGGVDHINEQWPAYWARLFAAHGYQAFDVIRPRVWHDPAVAYYYAQNLVLFAADDRFEGARPAFPLVEGPAGTDIAVPASLIHPGLLRAVAEQRPTVHAPSFSALARQLPRATEQALRRRLRPTRASGSTPDDT